jgi:DNA mismatch endonuclease, patch repair protein
LKKNHINLSRAARFDGLRPASESASLAKRANKGKNTAAELVLRRAIWRRGLRYRLHATDLPGKPDIIFRKARIVVFCDGDFWHGRKFDQRRERLARGSNGEYWIGKIEGNIVRDARQNRLLRQAGWRILRFWETDVLRNPQKAAKRVTRVVQARLK